MLELLGYQFVGLQLTAIRVRPPILPAPRARESAAARIAIIVRIGIRQASRIDFVFVEQDPTAIAVQILELSAASCPEEHGHGCEPQDQHAWYQAVNDIHPDILHQSANIFDTRVRQDCELAQSALTKVRMRAELPMTASELRGIETAAIKGVMTPPIASGTMTRL